MTNKPKISIITVVFNGAKHLEETILSITNQTYDNLEYIVIDGGSTDNTLDIIKKYEKYIYYWVSEKDNGISDAFNKGLAVSTGDYINFQGDGDGFSSTDSIDKLLEGVKKNLPMLISGRIERVSEAGNHMFFSKKIKKFRKESLLLRMSLPHQGLFTHKAMFDKYGLFDINNTFCMDYEHLLRAYSEFPIVVIKDIVVAKWRADGLGNNREIEILNEYDQIKRKNKVANLLILKVLNVFIFAKYKIKRVVEKYGL